MLSNTRILILAIAGAIVTANAYYIHPIIGPVADSFGVGDALVGVIPAANQIALALGVLLLLPLGDRTSNRKLVAWLLPVQVIALGLMAWLTHFWGFVLAATLLGFFTITPYLLPTWVSRRVEPSRLGFVTAVLTVGVVAGVQFARIGSGLIADLFGWRSVYWAAAALMLVASIVVPLLMQEAPTSPKDQPRQSYGALVGSLAMLLKTHPDVTRAGIIQGLNFGIFISIWMGIGLHLTSDTLNLGTDVVGYLSAFSLVSLVTTPRLGTWADRLGAIDARRRLAIFQLFGTATYALAYFSWWWLILPIVVSSITGPMIDVTGRMIGLGKEAAIRTRLMTVYVTLMFIGGSLGSWSGTYAYAVGGWLGSVVWAVILAAIILLLSRDRGLGKKGPGEMELARGIEPPTG